jgi:AraC-like DNA-binding protein
MIRYVEVAPARDLSPWVECYWSITGRIEAGTAGNRVVPDRCMDVILRFGDPPANRDRGGLLEFFVVGAMTSPAVVWQTGWTDVMGVRFRPGGARPFLGLPASELTDAILPLDTVWEDAAELFERTAAIRVSREHEALDGRTAALGARERLRARSRIVDTMLRRRIETNLANDPVVSAAMRLIDVHEGCIRMDAIEGRLGITQRSLERRFQTQIGLSPKVASRITRFQSAAGVLRSDPETPLARLAVERGYHDQAHMTREFREFAGLPPAAYALERLTGRVTGYGWRLP